MAGAAAIITVSTSKFQGTGEDESGPGLIRLAERLALSIAGYEVIPDEQPLIEHRLRSWARKPGCALILTSGGTGVAPTDVTPEATRAVIDRDVPGIAEAMRALSSAHTPHWMLSRALAGIAADTLIVNFPGSPRSIAQVGEPLLPAIRHAIDLIAGVPTSGHNPARVA